MIDLTILVEGKLDMAWTSALVARVFDRAGLNVSVYSFGGKSVVLNALRASSHVSPTRMVVALVDADVPSLADAKQQVDSDPALRQWSDRIFFAVPSIESWLFADTDVAKRFLRRTDTSALERIQFPDEIPLPKLFAMQVFGGRQGLEETGLAIMRQMNLDAAVTRSPSLRGFLGGLGQLLGDYRFQDIPDAEKLLGRRLLGTLVKETNPSSRVIYKTMSGERVTAEKLANEITQGTPLARQYAADLLRVARELLAQDVELDKESDQ